ncbi:MAG: hypothetical protein ACFFD1_04835 [Candidatus Thorarchaeota archaeon]
MIDHSLVIYHAQQTGMQCWVRSSQMIFSWILHKIGIQSNQIDEIFYKSLFPNVYFSNKEEKKEKIFEFNQRGLGRRLRKSEPIIETIDEFFVKIYSEFGSQMYAPEIFLSIITNYINILYSINGFPFKKKTLIIIFDNDEETEKFDYIIYKDFKSETNNEINTGCFRGQDKNNWQKKNDDEKIKIITKLLTDSPLLIEYPSHAVVLSGYDKENKIFIVNDSLFTKFNKVNEKFLLENLSTLVMCFKFQEVDIS